MNAIHPAFRQALSAFAPAQPVTEKRVRNVSPYEIEFRGRDQQAVQAAARNRANGIDAYRSPAVSVTRMDGDEWVTTLRYYNV